MKRSAAWALGLAVTVWAGRASSEPDAAQHPVLDVLEPTCSERLVEMDPFLDVLRVELDAAGFALGTRVARGSRPEHTTTLVVETSPCDAGATSVEVVVENGVTGRSARRVVPVWDTDRAGRPRVVALASAELVRASWRDLETPTVLATTPAPAPSTAPPPSAEPATPAAPSAGPPPREPESESNPLPRRPSALTLGAVFEYRSYPIVHTPMFGGRAVGRVALPGRALELSFDAGFASGAETDRLGKVNVQGVTVGAGLASLSRRSHGFLVAIGPALEGGYGYILGEAEGASTGAGQGTFVASVALDLGLRYEWTRGAWATTDALVGWSLSGIRGLADDRTVAGMSGALAAVRLGIAIAP